MHAPIHFQETRRARRVLLVGLGTLLMAACADELPPEPDAKSIPPKAAVPGVFAPARTVLLRGHAGILRGDRHGCGRWARVPRA